MREGERRGREQWRGREGGDVGRKGGGTSHGRSSSAMCTPQS